MSDTATVGLPSGSAMPLLGFGTWQLRGRQAYDAVRTALDAGYRHLDTATMYRNHEEVGRALRDSGVPRSEVFVTTKLRPDDAGRERRTIESSLRELGLDQLDLWLVHWPPHGAGVPTWEQFVRARDDGLTRDIGVSNYSLGQIDEVVSATGETPAVNQIRWSPWEYRPATVTGLRERGVVLEGYSPFKASRLDDPVLTGIAEAVGATPAQVVLRWHLQHGFVVIPRSSDTGRIRANADVERVHLSADEMSRLDALGRG